MNRKRLPSAGHPWHNELCRGGSSGQHPAMLHDWLSEPTTLIYPHLGPGGWNPEAGCDYLSRPRTLRALLHSRLSSTHPLEENSTPHWPFPAPIRAQMACKMFLALPWHCLMTLALVPFVTAVLSDHIFTEGFVGTSSAKQFIPQGQGLCIALWPWETSF